MTNEDFKKLKTGHRLQVKWTASLRGYVTGVQDAPKEGKRWVWISPTRGATREQSEKFDASPNGGVRLTEHAANDNEARKHLIEKITLKREEITGTRGSISSTKDELERKETRMRELVKELNELNEELSKSNE